MIFMIKIWLISEAALEKNDSHNNYDHQTVTRAWTAPLILKNPRSLHGFEFEQKKMIFSKNYHVKLYFWKYFWHACCPKFDSLPTFLISWIGPTIQAKKMFSLLKVPYINTRVLDIGIMCQYRYFNPGLCLTFSLTLLHWPFPYIVFGNGGRNEGVGSGGGRWCYKILKYLYQL